MNNDGFSYPIESYTESWGKKCYRYKCEECGIIIGRYYMKRVKGHIVCYKCRSEKENKHD